MIRFKIYREYLHQKKKKKYSAYRFEIEYKCLPKRNRYYHINECFIFLLTLHLHIFRLLYLKIKIDIMIKHICLLHYVNYYCKIVFEVNLLTRSIIR